MGGEPPPGPKLVSDHRPRRAKPRPLLHHASVAEAVLDDTDSRRPFNVAVDCLAEVAAPAAAAELPIAQDVDARLALESEDVEDRLVFHFSQRLQGKPALSEGG